MTVPKTRKRLPLSVTAFLLVLGLVAALNAVHVAGRMLLAKAAHKVVVKEGTVALSALGDAVLLRRELILVAPRSGVWHPKVAAGERVSANTSVGEILNDELLVRARQLQEEAKGEKVLWDSQLTAQKQQVEKELAAVNGKVLTLLTELKSDLIKLETVRAEQLNARLQDLLKRKSLLLAEQEKLERETASGGAWRQTEAEAQELMAQAATAVMTPLKGRFQNRLDGWEDVFDPLEYKTALSEPTPSGPIVIAAAAGVYVDQGQILGKITQEEPTFARVSMEQKCPMVALGDKVAVLFPLEQLEIPAEVVAVAHKENTSVLVLKLLASPPELVSVRETTVQVITSRVCGALVPEKALLLRDGQEGVYCWQQGKWQFIPVEIKALDQGQAIISGVRPGDEVASGLKF